MKPVEINITARDGWQSNHGMNVTADDFVSAYEHAGEYGVKSFQTEGGTTEDLNTKKGRDPAVYMKTVGDHFKQAGIEQTSLIRGECGSAYSRQPYDVLKATIKRQADNGVNVLQNFHAMNDINMLRGVTKASAELVEEHGYDLRVQGGITIQQNPDSLERKDEIIEEYRQFAHELVDAGHEGFYLKSANGVIPDPEFAADVIRMLKDEFPEQDVALHMHNTYGHVPKVAVAAIKAGVDSIDVLPDPLAEGTAQMSVTSLLHAIDHSGDEEVIARRPVGLNMDAMAQDQDAQYRVRASLSKTEMAFNPERLKLAEDAGSAGGAISALKGIASIRRGVAHAIGVDADDWDSIQSAIYKQKAANREALGYPTNVTPHELMQDLQAAHDVVAVAGGGKAFDVIAPTTAEYLTGALGKVSATVDKDLQARALEQNGLTEVITLPPIEELEPGLPKAKEALIAAGVENPTDDQILNAAISKQDGINLATGRKEPQAPAQLLRAQQEGGPLYEVAPMMFKVVYDSVELTKVQSGFYDGIGGMDERADQIKEEMEATVQDIEDTLREQGADRQAARKAFSYMNAFAMNLGVDNKIIPKLDVASFPRPDSSANPYFARNRGLSDVMEATEEAPETPIGKAWQKQKAPEADDESVDPALVIAGEEVDNDPFADLGDDPTVQ